MKKLTLLLILIPFFSFSQVEKFDGESLGNFTFRPVDPINYIYPIGFYKYSPVYYEKRFIDKLPLKETEKYATKTDTCFIREDRNIYFSDIPNEKIVDLLPNETVAVQITEIDSEGGITFKGAASLSAKNTSYEITMDYIKFVTVNVKNDSKIISYARVGVGLRLVASIKTKKKGLNLGDLFGLGVSASKNELNGSLSVNVLGIESSEVTSLLPMPSEISNSSIQSAMQAMATIKSKIYDENISIKPQIVSIRSVDEKVKTSDLIFNTSKYLEDDKVPSGLFITNNSITDIVPKLIKCGKCE